MGSEKDVNAPGLDVEGYRGVGAVWVGVGKAYCSGKSMGVPGADPVAYEDRELELAIATYLFSYYSES
jgi:hypothetical protein